MSEPAAKTGPGAGAGAAPSPRTAARRRARRLFVALLGRDLTVLAGSLKQFLPGTVMQPLLLVFVLTYVFPRIGLGIGPAEGEFSTLLMPGLIAQSIFFVGVFAVGMNLVRELDGGELDDLVLAPAPVSVVAFGKVAAGAVQALVAAAMVFPVTALVPATPVDLDADWLVLATILPLACLASSSLGLALGTLFEPRSVNWLFSMVALPLSFLGATFYSWAMLEPIPWLRYAVLANPLVYVSEGLRGGLARDDPHLPLAPIYLALVIATWLFTRLGVRGLRARVLS